MKDGGSLSLPLKRSIWPPSISGRPSCERLSASDLSSPELVPISVSVPCSSLFSTRKYAIVEKIVFAAPNPMANL